VTVDHAQERTLQRPLAGRTTLMEIRQLPMLKLVVREVAITELAETAPTVHINRAPRVKTAKMVDAVVARLAVKRTGRELVTRAAVT